MSLVRWGFIRASFAPSCPAVASPAVTCLALVQANFTGSVGTAIEPGSTVPMFGVGASALDSSV
ncbi:hypothetical protein [Accumulibacter sp.]|uniref:hypothetical protein n=1 Tax=Accumulibacter sp. TaxID=2053492 RepID=UPI0025ED8A21|nr:hypothetical protein [Accumulibacter sp.]MCM8625851.1 hypothetical protein [Accumulibacter sp.]